MYKIKKLTQEEFSQFENAEDKIKIVKTLLNISGDSKIDIGDTAVKISNAKPLEVYKNTWKDKNYFYIVIKSINDEMAMCYSIYPC